MGRLTSRLWLAAALARQGLGIRRRVPPRGPIRRVLVAHHLLLGDTLMLAPLFARLRANYPQAEIWTTVAPAMVPLFAGVPYGVRCLPYDPRERSSLVAMERVLGGPGQPGFDLALVPGDNRYALLARALGARWVRALDGDRPAWKNRAVDELLPWPERPMALADIFASLAGTAAAASGPAPAHFVPGDWPLPQAAPWPATLARPTGPYAVLHLGAGSPLRYWPGERWQALARHLVGLGCQVVWSAGPREVPLVAEADPRGEYLNLAGGLDLSQLWGLLAGARLLVCPDTGVAHLGKLAGVPTVCLFGPGSDVLFGAGEFWRTAPFFPVIEADFPCRDQRTLFKRELPWVRRCQRRPGECPAPRCMEALTLARVQGAVDQALAVQAFAASSCSTSSGATS